MENKEFNEKLVVSIPEMLKPYKEAKEWWDDEEPGTTIIVEDYLMPLIYKALEKKDEKTLSEVALWLEDMASSNDEVAKATLFIGVFEHAYFDGKIEDLKPYFLFYLYDFFDETSIRFIADCGGMLNNLSSSNITILTFFEKAMVDKWRNVQHRDKIRCKGEIDQRKAAQALEMLKRRFNVSSLPSLILVKKEDEGDKSIIIPLGKADSPALYHSFETIIKTINDNCEEDFSVLSEKILGEDSPSIGDDLFDEATNTTYLFNFIDESRRGKNFSDFEKLSASLGITRKTFYNKRSKGTFTRDECLKLGIIFGLDDNSLNKLLRFNNQRDLTFSKKDSKVREAIRKKQSFEEVESGIFGKTSE